MSDDRNEQGSTPGGEGAGQGGQSQGGQAQSGQVQGGTGPLEVVERIVQAADRGDGWRAAEESLGLGAGVAGGTAGVLDAIGNATNDAGVRDAARVVRTVQQVASAAVGAARQIGDAVRRGEAAVRTQSRHVEYELDIDGSDERWSVRSASIREALNQPYEVTLRVRCENTDLDVASALLGKDASLLLTRREEHNRRVCGVIDRVAEIGAREHHTELELRIVPALALLGHGRDSRVFQDKTAVQIVEQVLGATLRPYQREIDASGLIGTYATREMCVQYRESHLAFVSRLLEEEGIGYYFDFDGDHERLVLFDANSQLEPVTTMDGGAVPFAYGAQVIDTAEPVVRLEPAHRLTATSLTVRDLDWTETRFRAEGSRDGQDVRGRTRAVYEHGHGQALTLHQFEPGGRYGSNDADPQAQIRHELLVRDQQRFVGTSMLIGLRPGVTFELTGHPQPGMDGRYLVVQVRHSSEPPPGVPSEEAARGEEYHNEIECISAERTTYVPDRRTGKPAIYGVQTAIVSGPNEGEPFTDEYGRVRVQFHWDREAVDPSRTSAWVRLGQTWAGHDGSGLHTFLFLPRVGSEVIVTFLDGDPDRPLVTGSVYNARNLPPLALPGEASRSVIRTESLGGGGGHNELSFEDAGGREEVYLRAERNLRELVQHDHGTRVGHDQTNHVGHDQLEEIDHDQTLTVHGTREKVVDVDERNVVRGHRNTQIGEDGGNDVLWVLNDQRTTVDGHRALNVAQHEAIHVVGARVDQVDGGVTTTISQGLRQTIQNGGWRMTTTGNVSHDVTGGMVVSTSDGITMNAGADVDLDAQGGVSVAGRAITMRSHTTIDYSAPGGMNNLTPATETHVSQSFMQQASQFAEDAKMKFAFYTLALTVVAGLKVDIAAGLKIDRSGIKITMTKLEIGTKVAKIDTISTIDLSKAALHMIG